MSVQVIDTLKPKNNGAFPVVEAEDVAVSDELRLPEALGDKANQSDLEELSAEVTGKADASDITELQSQIDQIAQAAGTGSADTEVAQARVSDYGASYQTLRARLDSEWDQNQNTFAEIFDESTVNTDVSQIIGAVYAGNASAKTREDSGVESIELQSNSDYVSYYYIVTAACDIYVDEITSDYYSICHGSSYGGKVGDRLICTNQQRYRYLKNSQGVQENTLPTVSDKLQVSTGDVLVFSYKKNDHVSINGIKMRVIGEDFKEEMTVAVTPGVLTKVFYGEDGVIYDNSSKYDSTFEGYAKADGIVEDSGYFSYCLTVSENTDLYVEFANDVYFSICVYDDTSYTNGVRYRKFNDEDTLPYEDDPISVTAGQYIIFTVRPARGDTRFSVTCPDLMQKYLKEDIMLSQAQITQVKEETEDTARTVYRYINAEGPDDSVGRLEIYTPSRTGYIEWDFLHCVSEQKNANVWRMGYAYKTDKNFTKEFQITVGGEWELAVHLPDRDDFSGGEIHGDEVMTNVLFLVDGDVVDVTESESFRKFDELVIIESSNIYDPAEESELSDDEVTKVKIANHGSKHVFNSSGLTIHQTLEWVVDTDITRCYMAMHLPAKSVTDHAVLDSDFVPFEITTYGNRYENVKSSIIYGDESGIVTEFEVGDYPTGYEDSGKFLLTDNGGNAYNKCYFIIATSGNVTEGTLWKTETRYKFKAD